MGPLKLSRAAHCPSNSPKAATARNWGWLVWLFGDIAPDSQYLPDDIQQTFCSTILLLTVEPFTMTDTARWKATVYVGGLAPLVTAATIHDAFLPFGDIADVSLPKNENPNSNATEPHRGFAYVEFEDADDAKEAMDNMDQSELFGRVIKVTPAKAPKSADEGLGSKTAVWAQVR